MTSTIHLYQNRDKAERATSQRSRNAELRGECSQYELRETPNGFAGGYSGELATEYRGCRIVAQWSAGYRIQESTR